MNERAYAFEEFEGWNQFVLEIKDMDWSIPIREGAWTIHSVVTHILMWDQYFLEAAIDPIANHQPVMLKELDFDAFNQQAADYGQTLSKEELIELTQRYRSNIIDRLKAMDDEWSRSYADGKFTLESYMKDFIWHDQHHRHQIEEIRARQNA